MIRIHKAREMQQNKPILMASIEVQNETHWEIDSFWTIENISLWREGGGGGGGEKEGDGRYLIREQLL